MKSGFRVYLEDVKISEIGQIFEEEKTLCKETKLV